MLLHPYEAARRAGPAEPLCSGRRRPATRNPVAGLPALIAAAVAASIVAITPTSAEDVSTNLVSATTTDLINSQHFEFEGRCRGSGKDMVYTWNGGEGKIPSHDQFGKSFIYPWLDTDILIRGLELIVLYPTSGIEWLAVGNNTWGDFMLLLGHGETHASRFYPGAAFHFPAKQNMTPLTYIDLHGNCAWSWGGLWPQKARVFLELYYTPTGNHP